MKSIWFDKVSYDRNIDLGIDPECHECSSRYPQFRREGKRWLVHRYVYMQSTGESPEVVMHLCDNPKCINLNHLKGGTFKDNSVDMKLKGRSTSGESHSNRILSSQEVEEIRGMISSGAKSCEVARNCGISRQLVYMIKSRRIWD